MFTRRIHLLGYSRPLSFTKASTLAMCLLNGEPQRFIVRRYKLIYNTSEEKVDVPILG